MAIKFARLCAYGVGVVAIAAISISLIGRSFNQNDTLISEIPLTPGKPDALAQQRGGFSADVNTQVGYYRAASGEIIRESGQSARESYDVASAQNTTNEFNSSAEQQGTNLTQDVASRASSAIDDSTAATPTVAQNEPSQQQAALQGFNAPESTQNDDTTPNRFATAAVTPPNPKIEYKRYDGYAAIAPRTQSTSPKPSDAAEPVQQASAKRVDNAPKQGWAVQVGAFHDQTLATKITNELAAQGYKTFSKTQVAEYTGVAETRVYVGPEISQAQADELREELRVMEDLPGKVVFVE